MACALGNKACQQYRTVLYLSARELFDRITIAERTETRNAASTRSSGSSY